MSALHRIKQYLDYKGINNKKFEETMGFSNGSFASQLKKNKTIGVDKLEKILNTYSDLNPNWVLLNEGNMLTISNNDTILNYIGLNISYLVNRESMGKDAFGESFDLKRGTIGTYISGKALPKIETIQKICESYNISIDDFINTNLTLEENHEGNTEYHSRLKEFSELKGYKSINSFALNGLEYSSSEKLNRLKKDGNKPSIDILIDIYNKFKDFNITWFLTGNGDMIVNNNSIELESIAIKKKEQELTILGLNAKIEDLEKDITVITDVLHKMLTEELSKEKLVDNLSISLRKSQEES